MSYCSLLAEEDLGEKDMFLVQGICLGKEGSYRLDLLGNHCYMDLLNNDNLRDP